MNLDIHICPTNLLTQKQLQEIADLTTFCHRHDGIELSYPVEEESGPDHDKHFVVRCSINGKLYGSGQGHTKKAAEQGAAYETILMLRQEK